jgi:hypothetical protein
MEGSLLIPQPGDLILGIEQFTVFVFNPGIEDFDLAVVSADSVSDKRRRRRAAAFSDAARALPVRSSLSARPVILSFALASASSLEPRVDFRIWICLSLASVPWDSASGPGNWALSSSRAPSFFCRRAAVSSSSFRRERICAFSLLISRD